MSLDAGPRGRLSGSWIGWRSSSANGTACVELNLAHITTTALERARAGGRPVVLLWPVGATEPHGPHAPLATDCLISEGVCRRAAELLSGGGQVEALVLPTLPFGVTRYARAFPGAIGVSEDTLHAFVVDVCTSLAGQGFPYVLIVNSHFEPEHVGTLHGALDTLAAAGIRTGFLDLTRRERAQQLTEEFRAAECHAGRYETSLVLADRPELIDEAVARDLPYVPVNMARAIAEGVSEFRAMGLEQAYCGAPAEATAEEGERSYAVLAEMVASLALELAAGKGGRDAPGLFTRVADGER
jgi:creatinine amidohydrolase